MNIRTKSLGGGMKSLGGRISPITLESILRNLPEAQRRRSRVDYLRNQQERMRELQMTPGQGNYQPRQAGGLFPTVQAYQKDYERFGNMAAGGLGEILSGRQARKAEEDLNSLVFPEIMRAVEQMGQAKNSGTPSGSGESPSAQTLRAYMSLLGGPDMKDALGRDAYVSSTQKLKNGNLGLVMSNGDVRDTGIEFDPKMVVTNIPGQPYGVTTMQGGQGTFNPVTGFPGGQMPGQGQMPGSFDNPVGNGEQHIEEILGFANEAHRQGVPEDVIDSLLQQYLNPPGGGGMPPQQPSAAPGAPAPAPAGAPAPGGATTMPGGIAMVPTKAQEAGESEAARIAAQNAAAVPTAQAAATKKEFELDAEARSEARKQVGKLEGSLAEARHIVDLLRNHEGLDYIVGRWGGMVPDNSVAKTLFNVAFAGHDATAAMALHDQLYGQIYANAYESLRGGGHITEFEGKKVADARARMNRAQSKEEYLKAADDFLYFLELGLEKAKAAAQGGALVTPQPSQPPQTGSQARPQLPPGFSWED